jgi:hypothetical protein
MTDRDFFRNSARECRRMALCARTTYVRSQLLRWAREFDALATQREGYVAAAAFAEPEPQRALEPAD